MSSSGLCRNDGVGIAKPESKGQPGENKKIRPSRRRLLQRRRSAEPGHVQFNPALEPEEVAGLDLLPEPAAPLTLTLDSEAYILIETVFYRTTNEKLEDGQRPLKTNDHKHRSVRKYLRGACL